MKRARLLPSDLRSLLNIFVVLILISGICTAQELPKKIRGYKVHQGEVASVNDPDAKDTGVIVKFEKPSIAGADLDGVRFSINGTILVNNQSGTIDFLTFNDFRVNGIEVGISEYRHKIEFRKEKIVELIEPIDFFVTIPQALRAAAKELKDPKNDWEVTGRVFVFGKFKKLFFRFKRVVPVDVRFTVPNPLR